MTLVLPALPVPAVGMIWAQTPDGVIGRGGDMPWHAPEDMAHFKAATMGHPVVMGRRTWESIPPRFRPFAGRTNIVLTRDAAVADDVRSAGGAVFTELSDALAFAASAPGGELRWIVGGGALYSAALTHADVALVTVLDVGVSDGDTYAPALGAEFRLESASPEGDAFHASERGPDYRFEVWVRG